MKQRAVRLGLFLLCCTFMLPDTSALRAESALMDPLHLHATIRHSIWAIALIASVALVAFHLPQRVVATVPGTPAENSAQTAARTTQGIVDVLRVITAAKNGPSAFSPAIPTGLWNFAAGAGRTPTVTVYSAAYKPPTPAPVPTLAPLKGVDQAWLAQFQQWHHADTVAANEEALAKTPVNLQISQQEIQPNRVGAIYVSDGSMGGVYALSRRGQFDLDLGVTSSKRGLEAIGGIGANLKHTDAGIFIGVTAGRKPNAPGAAFGVVGGLVVHPQ